MEYLNRINVKNNISWSSLTVEAILAKYNVDATTGLSDDLLLAQKGRFGPNEIPREKSKTTLSIFIHQFASPLVYLLLIASVAAYFFGKVDDSLVILIVVLINSIIGTIQEGNAEKSLDSLRKLSLLKAIVLRNGLEESIPAKELVPGDIVKLSAGDGVPADGRLVDIASLSTSEAPLTGESLPVQKSLQIVNEGTPPSDQRNMVFSGTHVLTGRGTMVVTSTGLETEIGKIAHLTAITEDPPTPLEKKIKVFSHKIILIALLLLMIVVATGLYNGLEAGQIIMIAISQLVGLVPEGLPIAVTVALAVGVQRMAKKGAIVRKLSAVETLGSTTVICSDKTGTLTKNQMTVCKVVMANGESLDVTGSGLDPRGEVLKSSDKEKYLNSKEFDLLLYACVLCNDASLEKDEKDEWIGTGDPTETSLLSLAIKGGLSISDFREKYLRRSELPFDSDRKIMMTENIFPEGSRVFIKGAPEKILEFSDKNNSQELKSSLLKMSEAGLRVLGFGHIDGNLNTEISDEELRGKINFLGFVGQIDPPREEVHAAIESCIESGIKPIMVTGDHKITGLSIAKTLGMAKANSKAIEGSELDSLSEVELKNVLNNVSVFARIRPAQKLKIVKTLQNLGHVVAMTGDGVNDAPALSKADVGVAMGITGTEVSKQASEIIITDDNFSTIVAAIKEGRIVYGNLKKVILYLMSTSIAEVSVLLLALFLGFNPPLAAVQILWINLVTEGLVTINLILEPGEGDEMQRRPVNPKEALLSKDILSRLVFLATTITVVTFGWYFYRIKLGIPHQIVQTETFTLLALAQWFNVLNCRNSSKSALSFSILKNKWLLGGLVIGNILQILVVFWRPLGDIFHTSAIGISEIFILGAVASIVMWSEELRKYIFRRKRIKL